MNLITVFTPTYNRAYCLHKLYKSLCTQTNTNFEWLVVDDGSSDDTEDLIMSYIAEKKISISYYKQKNSGKHVAHNLGVELCKTELFVCVDSDDILTENAIDVILRNYLFNREDNILGLYFRKKFSNGRNIASEYPTGIKRVGITELYHKYNFVGDTVIVLKTNLIKNYRFPVFDEEKFVTERVFYNQLNNIAPMILCEDAIYIAEYLEDGYTKNAKRLICRNPYGAALDCLLESYYSIRLISKLKNYAQYKALLIVFDLDNNKLFKYNNASIFLKLFSFVFLNHYIKLYKEILQDFGKNEK